MPLTTPKPSSSSSSSLLSSTKKNTSNKKNSSGHNNNSSGNHNNSSGNNNNKKESSQTGNLTMAENMPDHEEELLSDAPAVAEFDDSDSPDDEDLESEEEEEEEEEDETSTDCAPDSLAHLPKVKAPKHDNIKVSYAGSSMKKHSLPSSLSKKKTIDKSDESSSSSSVSSSSSAQEKKAVVRNPNARTKASLKTTKKATISTESTGSGCSSSSSAASSTSSSSSDTQSDDDDSTVTSNSDDEKDQNSEATSSSSTAVVSGSKAVVTKERTPTNGKKKEPAKKSSTTKQSTAPAPANITTGDVEGRSSNASDTSKETTTTSGTTITTTGAATAASSTKKNKNPSSSTALSIPTQKSGGKLTYVDMIHESLVKLGDRSGSSSVAITKCLLGLHEHLNNTNWNKFKHSLNAALKSAVKSGRFIKVKASYKINPEWVKKEKKAIRAKEAEKKAKERKRQQEREKKRVLKKKRDEEEKMRKAKIREAELERKRKEQEAELKRKELEMTEEKRMELEAKHAAEAEAARRKAEEAARAKALAERIRKRKFPMDDLKLIAEDKELGVKPPDDVCKRPSLPYCMMCTIPFEQRKDGKIPSSIISASSATGLDTGSPGLVSDIMQVFHFFRGDVGYERMKDTVMPQFTMRNLIFAVNEILIGNAKTSMLVPPLISYLFLTALRILTGFDSDKAEEDGESPQKERENKRRLRSDLSKLRAGLCLISWPEVCRHYMDVMEQYYTSELSVETTALPGVTVSMENLIYGGERDAGENTLCQAAEYSLNEDDEEEFLPDGYYGYLGDPRGTLAKAHAKLAKLDPWNLSAEELMALLRALTDDILGTEQDVADEISGRGEELHDLLKAKRTADTQYRKAKLAFEGPKQPSKTGKNKTSGKEEPLVVGADNQSTEGLSQSGDTEDADKGQTENIEDCTSQSENGEDDKRDKSEVIKEVPKIAKKQLDAAEKASIKANDAYEKALMKLVSRTEPVGYDRNFNAVYFFQHDPHMLYVEAQKTSASSSTIPTEYRSHSRCWHVIEMKSLFDDFVSSLDVRGIRESELYEALTGCGTLFVRRHLHDDIKERNAIQARQREIEELERRLANAKIACALEEEGGRRSGRLASQAQAELLRIEDEIQAAKAVDKAESALKPLDYRSLTGLDMLLDLDWDESGCFECSRLLHTKDDEASGAIGIIVSAMLSLEGLCNALAPWTRNDMSRKSWIASLKDVATEWNHTTPQKLGPSPFVEMNSLCQNDSDSESSNEHTEAQNEKGGIISEPMETEVRSKRMASDSLDQSSGRKKRKASPEVSKGTTSGAHSNPPVNQVLSMLKQPLLDLEERVFSISGLDKADHEAEEAGENMSITSEEGNEEDGIDERQKMLVAWKRMIYALNSIPARRSGRIRETIAASITAARKARLGDVVVDLKSALVLYHPNAPGAAKTAALEALEKYGGYQEADGENNYESDEDDDLTEASAASLEGEGEYATLLNSEATMITGSLTGDDDADRDEWKDAVMNSKTISRFAALCHAFNQKATTMLEKVQNDHETLKKAILNLEDEEVASKGKKRGSKGSTKKKGKNDLSSKTEVWADTRVTAQFVLGKVEGCPWRPGRVCVAKDKEIASSLSSANRVLVSFIGDAGLHVLNADEVRPFSEDTGEDLTLYGKDDIKNLNDSLAMARRIRRARGIVSPRSLRSKSVTGFAEEKKSSV